MKRIFLLRLAVLTTAILAFRPAAHTQEQPINVVKHYIPGNTKPVPVCLSGFSGDVEQTLQFDLYVQGFSFTTPDKAQFLISGSNNGHVQGRVVDQVSKQTRLPLRSYSGDSLRRQAHWFADDVLRTITGQDGIAKTKIAFKVDAGKNSEIYVADFDGYNAQEVTRDNSLVAAPCWVPGKFALYYTSYKLGNPDIFYQDLSTGERRTVAHFSGLNTSAAVSPDGSKLAMILSKSGSPDVYVCNADGSGLKQLTATREDESSPCWSPDGQWVCFATKIRERRVLAKVPAAGGSLQVIRTAGVANPTEPDWSPDGKWIAFTSQMRDFNICVVPSEGGAVTVLVVGQDPSWSPNSRTLVYSHEINYRRVLAVLDMPTKQYRDAHRISGSNSQPSWAR